MISTQSMRWLLAELAVVILGILIAFQIEEWRSLRSEREFIESNLKAILMELEDEYLDFQRALPSLNTQMLSASILSNELRNDSIRNESGIYENYRKVFSNYTWIPNSPTYDGLRESGRLYLIPDTGLIDQLFDYYEFGDYVRRVFDSLNSSRALLRNASLLDVRRHTSELDQSELFTKPLEFELILPLEEIPRNPEFLSVLGNHMTVIQNAAIRTEDLSARNFALQESIRELSL
jgi:hypothetical protein